jgi:hypothetical protein
MHRIESKCCNHMKSLFENLCWSQTTVWEPQYGNKYFCANLPSHELNFYFSFNIPLSVGMVSGSTFIAPFTIILVYLLSNYQN